MGQFGERVQLDVVYVRDLAGNNHPILGIADMATSLHQAVRLHSRASAHVADQFRRCWLMPYGYPLVCEVDADGAFEGDFRLRMEEAGVHLVVIPPEAHWRIGTIERKNAVLRSIIERLLDENAVVSGDGLDWVLIAAVQAANSTTGSKGRSPYQAVFGRLPRFPGDLFGDDRALAVADNQMLAEELRCQALRVIDEMRASQVIRRALLRKTKPNKDESKNILPGSLAAYWRWTKRSSGKKRGGYVLGRLLLHDADGKSAWMQAGSTTVQVTYEQLRPAFGLETWTPSFTDIRALRDCEKTLATGMWEDHRGPGPPDDEPLEPEITAPVQPEDVAMVPDEPAPLLGEPPISPYPSPSTPLPPPDNTQQLPQALEHPQQPEYYHFSPTYQHNVRQDFHQHISIGDGRERKQHHTSHPYTRPSPQREATAFQRQLIQAQQHPQPSSLRPINDQFQQLDAEPETPQLPLAPETSGEATMDSIDETMEEPTVPPTTTTPTAAATLPATMPQPAATASNNTQPTSQHSSYTPHTNHSSTSQSLVTSRLPKMWSHMWSYYSFVVTEVPEEPFCNIERVKLGWDGNVKSIHPLLAKLSALLQREQRMPSSPVTPPTMRPHQAWLQSAVRRERHWTEKFHGEPSSQVRLISWICTSRPTRRSTSHG